MEQREDNRQVFELVEENAVDSPVESIKWYGKEDQTSDTELHDNAKGDVIDIRLFEWKFPPTLEKEPTEDELLTPGYLHQLQAQLWADGLRLVMRPRVHISKEGCKIFAPCQATTGNSFLDNPKTLQEWID